MRRMEDSIDPDAIDPSVQLVAGYIDGEFGPLHEQFHAPGWDDGAWARFPRAVHVRIATNPGTRDGTVGDVETGDMTPSNAVGWVHQRRVDGVDPTLYCNRSNLPLVRKAFAAANEPEPHYWLSTLDGTVAWLAGVVAVQYLGAGALGRNVDASLVLDYWPGVDPDPREPALAVTPDDGVLRS